jgi:prepilin-type N-terminal cleavage/methylation domain-containing protein
VTILRETHFARRLFGPSADGRHNNARCFALNSQPIRRPGQRGFTLVETLMSLFILGLVFGSTLVAYTRATERAEWAGYSLAAQSLCARHMEQFHTVLWDTQTVPITDDTTNIPLKVVYTLDIPISGGTPVYATNQATISNFTGPGPSFYKVISINTTWPWKGRVFTNNLVTIRKPDQ